MTDERFNALLAGPLAHPLPMFAITRLAIALRAVVEATGAAGEAALEAHCRQRQVQDDLADAAEEDVDVYDDDEADEFDEDLDDPRGP